MRNLACSLLAVLLFAGAPLAAQAPAANPAQPAPTPALKTWFIRLIPPRPDFDKAMTESELALMSAHAVYWKGLYEKGVCLFGGPVLDPKGVFGILVVEAASEDEARQLASGDPSVKAGVNRIEVAEMRIAFPPKTRSD